MSAKIIDGKAISEHYRREYKIRVDRLIAEGVQPGLAVIIVGEDAASQVYVRNKAKACESIGMHSEIHAMPANTSQISLLAQIEALNNNAAIHGILVQLPVPKHINSQAVLEAISPDKDVDGFHFVNVGALIVGTPTFPPCTPWGVMKMLEFEGINVAGKHAVVIGRSTIVGKPQALLLLNASATVTVCHSKTPDIAKFTRDADIVVAAVGRAKMLTGDMIKPGAVVIDVGINRDEQGKLCGDVDFASASLVASAITPVPGGVGPMTITMLLGNTIHSAERIAGLRVGNNETRIV